MLIWRPSSSVFNLPSFQVLSLCSCRWRDLMDHKSNKLIDISCYGREDRISKLPNAILCHILSFLPTTFAVRTTVLSKRWENVWTSVPNLDFDQTMFGSELDLASESAYNRKVARFINFVEMVLHSHDGLNIKKCSLKCDEDSTSSHFYPWVSAIITSKVQELVIESTSLFQLMYAPKPLPWSLFTCTTLIVLKIYGNYVLNIPAYVCFPSLKTLHLHWVLHLDGTFIERLFASCPVVEDIDIRRYWDNALNFNISIPSLKRLSMACYVYGRKRMRGYNSKIVVDAPKLEYLRLCGDRLEDYSFNIPSSLVEASISGTSAYELFKIVSHVRVLTLSGKTTKDLFFAKDDLPIFHNLTRLELSVQHYFGLQLLEGLLESSNNLEDLVFLEGLPATATSIAQCLPVDLFIHLKTIEIHRFWGRLDEVVLVEHLLQHAQELNRMIITCDDRCLGTKARNVFISARNRILMYPRASTSCELSIQR